MTELDVFLAALLISTALPIVFFLVFQRLFLRGAGLERGGQGLSARCVTRATGPSGSRATDR